MGLFCMTVNEDSLEDNLDCAIGNIKLFLEHQEKPDENDCSYLLETFALHQLEQCKKLLEKNK